jgi:AP-3 complex subunit mu
MEIKTGLGPMGSDFEVRLFITKVTGQGNSSISSLSSSSRSSSRPAGRGASGFAGLGGPAPGTSANAALEDLVVAIPLPAEVRNLTDIRASRGDTVYNPGWSSLEWHIPAKDAVSGGATLRCTVVGPLTDNEDFESNGFKLQGNHEYDDDGYQDAPVQADKPEKTDEQKDSRRSAQYKLLMPNSASVSFSVKGWLASGIKVESLTIDTRKSRGVGEGMKPYKGVKYLTVSRKGVEVRC